MGEFGNGDGYVCPPPEGPLPAIVIDLFEAHTMGFSTDLCFFGFGPQAVAKVVDPNGGVRTKRLDTTDDRDADIEGIAVWEWVSLPGEPEGDYLVSVEGFAVEAVLPVVAATPGELFDGDGLHAYVRRLGDVDVLFAKGPAGSIVGVVLAGYQPGSEVAVHFYGPQDSEQSFPYISTVFVPVNDQGMAQYEFSSPANAVGAFCASVGGPCWPIWHVFTLE